MISHTSAYLAVLDNLDGVKGRIMDNHGCKMLFSLCIQKSSSNNFFHSFCENMAAYSRRVGLLDTVQWARIWGHLLIFIIVESVWFCEQLEKFNSLTRRTVLDLIRVRQVENWAIHKLCCGSLYFRQSTVFFRVKFESWRLAGDDLLVCADGALLLVDEAILQASGVNYRLLYCNRVYSVRLEKIGFLDRGNERTQEHF